MTAADNRRLLDFLRGHTDDMVADLKRLIALESPTSYKPAVDELGRALAAELRELGGEVEVIPKAEVGDVLRARWNAGPGGVVILSHMDTVWDVGTVAERPTRVDGDRIHGVGSMDMKGGIVIALWALRALRALDLFPQQPISYLLNSDEETGSLHSAREIEAEALSHKVVFVTEPPQDGAYKTQRKGVSHYTITAKGLAAHSGADHASGVNAIEEIAHQVLAVEAMTDYDIGTTANVGVISGGTRPNVVPAEARVEINVRAWTKANQQAIHEGIMSLKAVNPESGESWWKAVWASRPLSARRRSRRSSSGRRAWRPRWALSWRRGAPAAALMATRQPRWACPRWTAWASWAKAGMRSRNTARFRPCRSGRPSWRRCCGRRISWRACVLNLAQ